MPTTREDLANRIATHPALSIALSKTAMDASENLPVFHALLEEEYLLNQTLATPEARRRLRLMLELGGQRRENELDMPALLAAIGRAEAEYTDKDLTVGGQ